MSEDQTATTTDAPDTTTKQDTTTTTVAEKSQDTATVDNKTDVKTDVKDTVVQNQDTDIKIQEKWPENWRDEMAGDDEVLKRELSKLTSPSDVARRVRELSKLMSSGGHKKPPTKEDPPEKWAAWRKANDIPEKPEEYDTELSDGLVIGEADKPVVNEFLKIAHENNLSKDQVKQNLAWYFATQEKMAFERQESDATFMKQAEDSLRQEWGGDYRMNVENFLPMAFIGQDKGVYEVLRTARASDGTLLGSRPDVLTWLVRMGRELNPDAAVMPHVHGDKAQAIGDELEAIRAKQGDYSSEYWKGEKDAGGETKLQKRYRELVEARDKLSKK